MTAPEVLREEYNAIDVGCRQQNHVNKRVGAS